MSDRFPAEIHIGGTIPRKILPKLIRKIVETGASLGEYDGPIARQEETTRALSEGQILHLYDYQATNGRFDDLENFLIRHHLHHDIHRDAYQEYDAELFYYRNNSSAVFFSSQSGQPLLPLSCFLEILDNAKLNDAAKVRQLHDLVHHKGVEPLQPIHLI